MLRYELGVTREDRIRNVDIRQTLEIEKKLMDNIKERRLRWFGHVSRRDENYVGKRVMNMVVGTRKRGRPKRRWSDCNREDLESIGAVTNDAKDRKKWKRMIRTGNPV